MQNRKKFAVKIILMNKTLYADRSLLQRHFYLKQWYSGPTRLSKSLYLGRYYLITQQNARHNIFWWRSTNEERNVV